MLAHKNKTIGIIISCVLLFSQVQGGTLQRNNVILEMMQSMLEMFSIWNQYQNTPDRPAQRPNSLAPNHVQTIPPFTPQNTQLVNGAWLNEQDSLLIIYQGFARIYSKNHPYQNYLVSIRPGWLQMTQADSRKTVHYQLELQMGEMLLRNQQGNFLRFIKVAGFQQQ